MPGNTRSAPSKLWPTMRYLVPDQNNIKLIIMSTVNLLHHGAQTVLSILKGVSHLVKHIDLIIWTGYGSSWKQPLKVWTFRIFSLDPYLPGSIINPTLFGGGLYSLSQGKRSHFFGIDLLLDSITWNKPHIMFKLQVGAFHLLHWYSFILLC